MTTEVFHFKKGSLQRILEKNSFEYWAKSFMRLEEVFRRCVCVCVCPKFVEESE